MASVELRGVRKSYGAGPVLDDIDLTVEQGEFVTLLGASGSGKTTCLRTVAGFVKPDSGQVYFGDQDVTRLEPNHRNAGMVFQQYALFPHLTVAQNVAFALNVRRLDRTETARRTREALQLVRLHEHADRYPAQLSGGQRQRVALARAVVFGPQVLLLDEPLSALDLHLREELQGEIRRVQQSLGITTLFVTHDQNEAMTMSDRVAVMDKGRICQIGSPQSLYEQPASLEVAGFVGRMSFVEVLVQEHNAGGYTVSTPDQPQLRLQVAASPGRQPLAPQAKALLALRPEHLQLGDAASNQFTVDVEQSAYVGDGWMLACRLPGGVPISVRSREAAAPSRVRISWRPDHGHLFAHDPSWLRSHLGEIH